jgi:hypothetical protein
MEVQKFPRILTANKYFKAATAVIFSVLLMGPATGENGALKFKTK